MPQYLQTIRLGEAVVNVISIGDLHANLHDLLHLPESEWPPEFVADFRHPLRLPMRCVLIRLPHTSVLVDTSVYEIPEDSPFAIPGYEPPLGLLERLAELGVDPASIDHVVITHTHFDHYNGTTRELVGHYEPSFPNARYYVGRGDWEREDIQQGLKDVNSLVWHTLGRLKDKGLLELVTGNHTICDEVEIIHAPGESPGHQIVRVRSEGKTLYCLGDLYHHQVEIAHPELMSPWADSAAMQASRRALVESALAEDALLVVTHIPTIGRLHRADSGVVWRDG